MTPLPSFSESGPEPGPLGRHQPLNSEDEGSDGVAPAEEALAPKSHDPEASAETFALSDDEGFAERRNMENNSRGEQEHFPELADRPDNDQKVDWGSLPPPLNDRLSELSAAALAKLPLSRIPST